MSKPAIHPKISRAELAAIVFGALKSELGDEPVLVGGAAASIYSEGRYLSDDLDIVTWRDSRRLRPVMSKLGFVEKGSYWEHPRTNLLIQFVNPPVMIGRKHVKAPARMKTAAGELPILSPLDSACDRLAWFLEGDAPSLEQCIDVVVAQQVPLAAIAKWLENETWPERTKESAMNTLKKRIALRRKRGR